MFIFTISDIVGAVVLLLFALLWLFIYFAGLIQNMRGKK